jgi:hypothetical protein
MKKLIVSIGSLLIMTFVVALFINATESKKDTKKARTEIIKDETAVPCSVNCNHSTGNEAAICDPLKCKELNCDPKNGKCDPATCSAHKEVQPKEAQMCGSSAACKGTCHTKTSVVK